MGHRYFLSMVLAITFLFSSGLVVSLPAHGKAQNAADANQLAAKVIFKKARRLYQKKKYIAAIVQLKKAYRLKPHPLLLRYLAQTYYNLNRPRLALGYYERYLKMAKAEDNKDEVLERIEELNMVLGNDSFIATPVTPARIYARDEKVPSVNQKKTSQYSDQTASTEVSEESGADVEEVVEYEEVEVDEEEMPEELNRRNTHIFGGGGRSDVDGDGKMGWKSVTKWTAASVAVAGAAVGVTALFLQKGKNDDLRKEIQTGCPGNDPDCLGNPDMNAPVVTYNQSHHDAIASHQNFKMMAITGFIIAGVSAATSATFFYLDRERAENGEKNKADKRVVSWGIAPAITPEGVGFSGELRF